MVGLKAINFKTYKENTFLLVVDNNLEFTMIERDHIKTIEVIYGDGTPGYNQQISLDVNTYKGDLYSWELSSGKVYYVNDVIEKWIVHNIDDINKKERARHLYKKFLEVIENYDLEGMIDLTNPVKELYDLIG
jgi:hypothetical protein